MKFESEIHVGRFLGIKGEVKMFAFLEAVNDTDNDFFHFDEETRPDQQKDKDKSNENNNDTSNPRECDR